MIVNKFNDMNNQNIKIKKGQSLKLFSAPFLFQDHKSENGYWCEQHFYMFCWELYAKSIFSYQPSGDSLTRRAFYDSWMFNCIPVISESSAKEYSLLFDGLNNRKFYFILFSLTYRCNI